MKIKGNTKKGKRKLKESVHERRHGKKESDQKAHKRSEINKARKRKRNRSSRHEKLIRNIIKVGRKLDIVIDIAQ